LENNGKTAPISPAAWSTAAGTGGRPQELILLEQQMRMILLKTNNS
jgi:hypothetical protein